MLAESFSKGATEVGHEIIDIDAAHAHVSPCIGCVHCGYEGECSLSDGMNFFRKQILDADTLLPDFMGLVAAMNEVVPEFKSQNSEYEVLDTVVKKKEIELVHEKPIEVPVYSLVKNVL